MQKNTSPPHNKINGCADNTKATQAPHQAQSLMRCKANQTQKHQHNYSTATSTTTAQVSSALQVDRKGNKAAAGWHCRHCTRQSRPGLHRHTTQSSTVEQCDQAWSAAWAQWEPSQAHHTTQFVHALPCCATAAPHLKKCLDRKPADCLGVRVRAGSLKSTCTMPNRCVKPSSHSRLSMMLHAKYVSTCTTTASHESVHVLLLHGISTATTAPACTQDPGPAVESWGQTRAHLDPL